jgi:hypothetical protein
MSTLASTYIQDRVQAKPHLMASVLIGSAKAYAFIYQPGTVPSLYTSFNTASLTDTSVGVTAVNFSAQFAAANGYSGTSHSYKATNWVNSGNHLQQRNVGNVTIVCIENNAVIDSQGCDVQAWGPPA